MDGDEHDMARAMAMASVLTVTKDKRDITVIGYNGYVTSVHEFTKYKTGNKVGSTISGWSDTLHSLGTQGCGGGTDFDPALKRGIKELGKDERADMIVLTDGDAGVSRSVVKKIDALKKNKGLRITTVIIGGHSTPSVEAFSDTVIKVDELTEEGCAKAIGTARKR